jgi:curved DNA-binding protein CbpA
MPHRTRDHYSALGVPTTATPAQIKAAYRKLARELHPDASVEIDARAERRFKRVAHAYDIVGNAKKRRAYDERHTRGRFAAPGAGGPQRVVVDEREPVYHMDLGHHSDFYQAGDPLSVKEAAALVERHPAWLRTAIRSGRLRASRDETGYLLRRRDVERLDRTAVRRKPKPSHERMRQEAEAEERWASEA